MISDFPVPSRDVTNQTLPGQEWLNYIPLGKIWFVTFRLGMGKSLTFVTVYKDNVLVFLGQLSLKKNYHCQINENLKIFVPNITYPFQSWIFCRHSAVSLGASSTTWRWASASGSASRSSSYSSKLPGQQFVSSSWRYTRYTTRKIVL